jgi:hypothetical protein
MRQSSPHNLLRAENKTSFQIPCQTKVATAILFLFATISTGCHNPVERQGEVRPLVLRDVPAQRLAYRFDADTGLPAELKTEDPNNAPEAIHNDFNTKRKDDALLRTVASADGQRVLALYGTGDQPNEVFRIDLYSSDGKFLRNLTPPDLSCVFPETVSWSPDGNFITFIAHRRLQPSPSPTPLDEIEPTLPPGSATAVAKPPIAPAFAPVPTFSTEQIYICNRDGYELKPLTSRDGMIYFALSWAPDNHALAALACKEDEWRAREKEFKQPAGRPRLITPDGKERLLDDQSTEAWPVWSPDSSKVATAFDTDVAIYDAATSKPTQARIPLREDLITASRIFEAKNLAATQLPANSANRVANTSSAAPHLDVPASFNPTVRLEWPAPEKLYIQTAYVRLMRSETINTFPRWHLVFLSAQAARLK